MFRVRQKVAITVIFSLMSVCAAASEDEVDETIKFGRGFLALGKYVGSCSTLMRLGIAILEMEQAQVNAIEPKKSYAGTHFFAEEVRTLEIDPAQFVDECKKAIESYATYVKMLDSLEFMGSK